MPGLYIHIPFCVSKCAYCDFLSFPPGEQEMEEYTDTLCREMELWKEQMQNTVFDTMFIGGGTPSLLPLGRIAKVLDSAFRCFHILPAAEITIEANPDSLRYEKVKAYAVLGMNRISIGLQSAQDRILRLLGRPHTVEQFLKAVEAVNNAGIVNINADVMYGLPTQTLQDYIDTIYTVLKTGVTHVSSYSLIVEQGTPFFIRQENGMLNLPNEEEEWNMEKEGRNILGQHGFKRYEVSNYAKDGYQCRHNINYWQNGMYLGLGLGAHSRIGTRRLRNSQDLKSYFTKIYAEELPTAETLNLTKQDDMFETVMMGLRLCDGLDTDAFLTRFGVAFEETYPQAIQRLVQRGLLQIEKGKAVLTERGMEIMNAALIEFLS